MPCILILFYSLQNSAGSRQGCRMDEKIRRTRPHVLDPEEASAEMFCSSIKLFKPILSIKKKTKL